MSAQYRRSLASALFNLMDWFGLVSSDNRTETMQEDISRGIPGRHVCVRLAISNINWNIVGYPNNSDSVL